MKENNVLARLAQLKKSSISDLRKMWEELFDAPPTSCNRTFLESRLAYRIQELSHGGLSEDSRQRIRKLREEITENIRHPMHNRPPAGTVLVREWCEVEHRVRVLPDGFEYAGKPYKSLSAIAHLITGTHWNGPMFFGLRSKRKKT
jgi:hypothetical protein